MSNWRAVHNRLVEELTVMQQKNENKDVFSAANSTTMQRIAQLEKQISAFDEIKRLEDAMITATEQKNTEQNNEMKQLWQEEIVRLTMAISTEQNALLSKLINSKKESVIIEIRAGQGGQEASIFAKELYEMYCKLCKKRNWTCQIISTSYSDLGIKEIISEITGEAVSNWLISESGVHCVKRVPTTEKKGRIHTSTASVAILPEPTEIEVRIDEKDLKIDVFRSSGPGGQSVNTTDSAVRITHLPTGLTVSQQDEKSQHKNKEKALKILRARLYQKSIEEEQSKIAEQRRDSIGKAQRNERIRTYHFTQNWVNDCRLEEMCHNISDFMEGNALNKFLNELIWTEL